MIRLGGPVLPGRVHVVVDQAVTVGPKAAVAAGDGVHGAPGLLDVVLTGQPDARSGLRAWSPEPPKQDD